MVHGEHLSGHHAMPHASWQTIAESIPHIVWVASADGHIEYMNSNARAYTGWPHDASLSDIGPAILHPDDAPDFYRAWGDAVRTEQVYSSEYRLRRADGEYRWHCGRGQPARDAGGKVLKWIGTATEVEDQKRSEAVLRDASDRLREIGDRLDEAQRLAHVGSWSVDVSTGTRLWSDELYRLLGHEPGAFEPDQERFFERLHQEDAGRVRAAFGAQLLQTEVWEDEFRIVRPSGAERWLRAHTQPVLGDAGEVVRVYGTAQDVSERKEAIVELERAYREAKEALTLLGTLQAEAPVGFGFIDRDLRVVRVNQELASILGASMNEVAGMAASGALPPALWEQVAPVCQQVLATGEAVRDQLVVESRGAGQTREMTTSFFPVQVEGEIVGIGVVIHDVTERVRAEGFRSALMTGVKEGVFTLDRDGQLMYLNRAASRMLGWTEGELRGKYMPDVINLQKPIGGAVSATERAFLSLAPGDRLEQFDGEVFTRKDGSTFPVAYSAVPLHIGPTVEGVVVVFRDISTPGASPNVIRVLIVDPDRTAAKSFQALLARHGIEVVSVAPTSGAALEAVADASPAVVLVDFALPDLDGLQTAELIKYANPSTNVILMTATHDDALALASIQAGCAGLLDKSRAWVELVGAVRAAYHGETIIPQEELQRVVSKIRGGGHPGRGTELTDREEEVLACMRKGLSNAQAAERLGITPNTVRNHVQRILFKLNVHSKLEAVVVTSREGLHHDGR